jgi:hypothetical protein
MLTPFPEDVEVPQGLVTVRTIWGLPPGIFAVLLVLAIAPLYVWGWRKWWVSAIAVGLGWLLAEPAREDPEFGTAWSGEMRFKDYYE